MSIEHAEDWSRDSLQLLYEISNTINLSGNLEEVFNNTLLLLTPRIGASAAIIRLIDEDGNMELAAQYNIQPDILGALQNTPLEGSLFSREEDSIDEIRKSPSTLLNENLPATLIAVPIRHLVRTLGVLNLFYDKDIEFSPQTALMLVTLGQHIGQAVTHARQTETDMQKRVQHERNMLANELHDSLAQTLASLRLQTRVLDQSLQPLGDFDTIQRIEKIEHGLDQAYTELRQVIAYCRGPLEHQGLQPAIEAIVAKFRAETGIHILLQCEHPLPDIPTSMEINAYRIVQEALNNIKKHSEAKIVRVLLNYDAGEYTIMIENDGRGFNQYAIESKAGRHLGLTIMKERANHLGGELKIESEPDEGTRVELKFHYSEQDEN